MMRSLRGARWRLSFFEKGDDLGLSDGAFDELEVDVPESDARHGGELVPCEAETCARRCLSLFSGAALAVCSVGKPAVSKSPVSGSRSTAHRRCSLVLSYPLKPFGSARSVLN
jgi:hypothetical protein